MKNKKGAGIFFYLKLTIFDVWDMPNGFIVDWVTPGSL